MQRDLVVGFFTHGNPGIKGQECMFLAYNVKVLRIQWLNILKRPQFLQPRSDTLSYMFPELDFVYSWLTLNRHESYPKICTL